MGKKCVLQLCSQRLDPSACITLYNQLRNLYDDNKKEKKTERERVLTEVMIASNHIRKKKLF